MQLIEMPTTKKSSSQIAQKVDVPKTKRKIRYIRNVEKLENIPDDVKEDLKRVAEKYVFRANDYYLDLIDWNDPMTRFVSSLFHASKSSKTGGSSTHRMKPP